MLTQLDLFNLFSGSAVETMPATPPNPTPSVTVTHNPLKGYRVVMAPGLTTKPTANPCLSCPVFGRDMDVCSEHCQKAAARVAYLEQIGIADVSAVGIDGLYGIGH